MANVIVMSSWDRRWWIHPGEQKSAPGRTGHGYPPQDFLPYIIALTFRQADDALQVANLVSPYYGTDSAPHREFYHEYPQHQGGVPCPEEPQAHKDLPVS